MKNSNIKNKIYRVSASVYPTNRIIAKRARDSSGRVPLYEFHSLSEFINLVILPGERIISAVKQMEQRKKLDEEIQRTATPQETTQETTQEILRLIKEKPMITRKELAQKIGLSEEGVKYHLTKMRKNNVIKHIKGYWEILR